MALYGPTPLAVAQPRRYFIEAEQKWVGIGGTIKVTNEPPTLPESYIIPEATQAEYKTLREVNRLIHLVQIVNNESEHAITGAVQSDTGVDQ